MNSTYCDTSAISPSIIITNNTSNTVSNVPYSVSFEGNVLASGTISQLLSMESNTIGFGPVALSVDTAVFETWFNLTGAYFNDTIYFTSLVSNITASSSLNFNISCYGDSTAEISASAIDGINDDYSYLWSSNASNATTDTVKNLPAGIYIVTVSDPTGCFDTSQVNVTEPNAIDVSLAINNDTIKVNQSGAAYQWLNCDSSNQVIVGATSQTYSPTMTGNYAVVVSLNGCSDTSICINNTMVLVEDLVQGVEVYPNPTLGLVVININNKEGLTHYSISAVDGKTIYSGFTKNKQVELDLRGYDNGVYVLNVNNQNSSNTYKIVKL
jgi:hypothetical protein